jgi:hypothetical protein
MKTSALSSALLLAALAIAPAPAATKASPSGDTCTVTGSGPVYTLHVSLPSGAQQFGLAFSARGTAVVNAVLPGANGSFTTQGKPANTSGVWLSDAPLPASSVVTLTTAGKATSLTIVPASTTTPSYLSPVACRFTSATGRETTSFAVGSKPAYSSTAGAWRLVVTIPSGGIVSARQLEPTSGTGTAATVTPKPLVQARMVGLKTGGKVTLMLRPTSKGMAMLRADAPLHVSLHVTFDATGGGSATKSLTLTLRKQA